MDSLMRRWKKHWHNTAAVRVGEIFLIQVDSQWRMWWNMSYKRISEPDRSPRLPWHLPFIVWRRRKTSIKLWLVYNELFSRPLRHRPLVFHHVQRTSSWQKLQYKLFVRLVAVIFRVYRQCRARPPPDPGCSSKFRGRGWKVERLPAESTASSSSRTPTETDNREEGDKKRREMKWEVDDLFMQYSHSSVMILGVRSAVEEGGGGGALGSLLFSW